MGNACVYCKRTDVELRPYARGGQLVCFKCAFATPDRKAETENSFRAQLDAAGQVVLIGEETGPRPLVGNKN